MKKAMGIFILLVILLLSAVPANAKDDFLWGSFRIPDFTIDIGADYFCVEGGAYCFGVAEDASIHVEDMAGTASMEAVATFVEACYANGELCELKFKFVPEIPDDPITWLSVRTIR